jgi:hypothetical protein
MKHILKPLSTVIIFLITMSALSQKKFLEGYIITLNKDTVQGYLADNIVERRVNLVFFKKK